MKITIGIHFFKKTNRRFSLQFRRSLMHVDYAEPSASSHGGGGGRRHRRRGAKKRRNTIACDGDRRDIQDAIQQANAAHQGPLNKFVSLIWFSVLATGWNRFVGDRLLSHRCLDGSQPVLLVALFQSITKFETCWNRFVGDRVLSSFPEILTGFIEFYRVLPSIIQLSWDFNGFYSVLPSFTGFYRVLPSFTEYYPVFLEF